MSFPPTLALKRPAPRPRRPDARRTAALVFAPAAPMPAARRAALLARCRAACVRMGEEGGEYWILNYGTMTRYLAGVTQRLFQKWPEACTDPELERTALALEDRAARLTTAFRAHARRVVTAQRVWADRRNRRSDAPSAAG